MAEYEDEPLYLPLTKDTPFGSKVICIDDDRGNLTSLKLHKVYTVDYFEHLIGGTYVFLKDAYPRGGWALSRFQVI